MQCTMDPWLQALLQTLALPEYGLSSLFIVSLLSATLLPMASIPFVYGLIQLNPELFWPTLLVATAGNTAGGAITYWMGYGAERAYEKLAQPDAASAPEAQAPADPAGAAHRASPSRSENRALGWLRRWGPPACLLSWLPVVGDPLCGVAGWLRLPFWPCVAYMAVGKFLRYLFYTVSLVWAFPLDVAPAG
jgi:membrane protein YqaA with SNARE-associated domain